MHACLSLDVFPHEITCNCMHKAAAKSTAETRGKARKASKKKEKRKKNRGKERIFAGFS